MLRKVIPWGGALAITLLAVWPGPAPGQTQDHPGGYQASPPETVNPDNAPAYITVRLPPGAELWFDGLKMAPTGHVRVFHSPPLTPRVRYVYEIRARWLENGRPVTQTQTVAVYAGELTEVDFPTALGIEAQRFWRRIAATRKGQ
jgi:uncharacterized protein (TIGR03000 family)